MKIAIIGMGKRMARLIIQVAGPDGCAAYADPDPQGLELAAELGVTPGKAYADAADMLRDVRPDIVVIGSPNHLHLEHIRMALAAGARVVCEKPVVRNMDESWAMAELAARHDPDQLLVALPMRSAPLYRKVMEYINAGKLGDIISVEANEHLPTWHGGFLMRDWRRTSAWGGSFMLDKCCHDFDVFRSFFNNERITTIASIGGRRIFTPEHKFLADERMTGGEPLYGRMPAGWGAAGEMFSSGKDDIDVTDHQCVMARFEGGAPLVFHANTHAAKKQRRWYIAGVTGIIESDFVANQVEYRSVNAPDDAEITTTGGFDVHHYGADEAMGEDLRASLFENRPFTCSVHDALVAGLTIMAADESMQNGGQAVDCTPLWDRLDSILPPVRQATKAANS